MYLFPTEMWAQPPAVSAIKLFTASSLPSLTLASANWTSRGASVHLKALPAISSSTRIEFAISSSASARASRSASISVSSRFFTIVLGEIPASSSGRASVLLHRISMLPQFLSIFSEVKRSSTNDAISRALAEKAHESMTKTSEAQSSIMSNSCGRSLECPGKSIIRTGLPPTPATANVSSLNVIDEWVGRSLSPVSPSRS
mmetsp:Transcript_64458/g.104294  ORF Transcript_64458/g.104294 Transcript_64458/m.104294 type:complete len:201 (-) Transcript_64458:412-1014(-)